MKNSIYREPQGSHVLTWGTKVSEIDSMMKAMPEGHLKNSIGLKGLKGSGKSTLLEWVSTHYPHLNVAEGDVVTMAVRSRILDADGDMTIGDFAKSNLNPWEMDKDEVTDFTRTHFGEYLNKIDVMTCFRGDLHDLTVFVVPDYKSHQDYHRKRTAAMLADSGDDEWKKHVKENHKPLTYDKFVKEYKAMFHDSDAFHIFINFGQSEAAYSSQFESILMMALYADF